MQAREKYEFTPVRITFWIIMAALASFAVYAMLLGTSKSSRGSPRAACILSQRNLQQAIRAHAAMEGLKPGDPLDWSKIIGPGLFLETKPACPVHGDLPLSPVIPEIGTLAAPCQDPDHRPAGIHDW